MGGMADGHVIYRPRLLREVREARGHLVTRSEASVLHEVGLDDAERELLRKSLSEVVNGEKGTGWRARVPGVWVGGKTGSAQNPHGDVTHAIFVGAAPLDDPRIAVAIVLENAGGGGAVAAPIAGALMRRFFENAR
jgi:penicillin-binding protein 2